MINIFSQEINKGTKDYTYDCSISGDLVCYSHTIIHEKNNVEIVSSIMIDFPTLRNFFNGNKEDYKSDNYVIKNSTIDRYEIISSDDRIFIPKLFLEDSFNVLNKMWLDE